MITTMKPNTFANAAIKIIMILLEAKNHLQFVIAFKSVVEQYFSDIYLNINEENSCKRIFLSSHLMNNMNQQKQRLAVYWSAHHQKIVVFVNQHLLIPSGKPTPSKIIQQLNSTIELILNSYPRQKQCQHLLLWIKAKISNNKQEIMSLKDRCMKVLQKNPQSEQCILLAIDTLIQLQRHAQAQVITTKRLKYLQAIPKINLYIVSQYYLYKYFILCKANWLSKEQRVQCIKRAFTLCKKNKSVNDYLIIEMVTYLPHQAKQFISQIIEQTGDERYFLPALALLQLLEINFQKTRQYLERISDIVKDQSPQVFYQYAFFMNAIGFIVSPCQILLNNSPLEMDNGYFQQIVGRILYQRQQYEAALSQYAKCKLQFCEFISPKIMIALCLVGLQRKEEAKEQIRRFDMGYCRSYEILLIAQMYIQLGMTYEGQHAMKLVTKRISLRPLSTLRLGYFKLRNCKAIPLQTESEQDILLQIYDILQARSQNYYIGLFQINFFISLMRFLIYYCFQNNRLEIGRIFVNALGYFLQKIEYLNPKGTQILRKNMADFGNSVGTQKHHIQV